MKKKLIRLGLSYLFPLASVTTILTSVIVVLELSWFDPEALLPLTLMFVEERTVVPFKISNLTVDKSLSTSETAQLIFALLQGPDEDLV
jgi:hypothetical protein